MTNVPLLPPPPPPPSLPQIEAARCAPLRAVYPSALNLHRCSSEGEKEIQPRQCPPALSTTRRGVRPVSGSLNMVTTPLAEEFSPPTTKGREPPASLLLFVCHIVVVMGVIPVQLLAGEVHRGCSFLAVKLYRK